MVFVVFLQLMVWWRHKRYSWVFPSRRDRAASIDLHNLKMSPQWLKIWQEQKNKLPDTSSNPEGWHRQNYVWVFMLHIQKKNYRNAQSERLESVWFEQTQPPCRSLNSSGGDWVPNTLYLSVLCSLLHKSPARVAEFSLYRIDNCTDLQEQSERSVH